MTRAATVVDRRTRRLALQATCLGVMSLGAGLLLAGCGQRGPLYLPVKKGEQKKEQKTPEPIKSASPTGGDT
ncbi:MAG: lipoprotein [Arenicellales bacterium]|jgi:predicted small lipoprotein YifL